MNRNRVVMKVQDTIFNVKIHIEIFIKVPAGKKTETLFFKNYCLCSLTSSLTLQLLFNNSSRRVKTDWYWNRTQIKSLKLRYDNRSN
jgi:hypothetical protein